MPAVCHHETETANRNREGRSVARRRGEDGVALLGTLLVVVILGVIAVIVLNSGPATPPSSTGGTTLPGPTSTTPHSVASGADVAVIAACQSDLQNLASARDEYRAINGSAPPAGTTWATSSANGGPLIQAWPDDPPYFTITWNGATFSVLPRHGAASHGSPGTSAPPTGCYAAGR